MTLREILHAHIPTLTATSTVRDAVDKMDIYQFPALVVVDQDRVPIGVVTEGDISRAAALRNGIVSLAGEPALEFGSRQPTTIPASTEVSEALHRMISSGLTILPVVEDGTLSGVVLRVDLMQAMLLDSTP